MKVLDPHSRGYVLGKTVFSNPRRTLSYVLVLFLLAAIPFTHYLVNRIQNVSQQAANGKAECMFIPGTVRPGETAELLISSYPYKVNPYIEPANGYVMNGQTSPSSLTYQFNTPHTTWTASLLDPANPQTFGRPNKIASCTVSTSNK